MALPKKIHPCPILECNIEIQFEPDIPLDAVFGVIYSQFKAEFGKVEKLPILQLPEHIRMADPNLKHQPNYKLVNDSMALMIGPRVINIGYTNEYIGWEKFSGIVNSYLDRIIATRAISKITRYGIRYINFFTHDLIGKTKVGIDTDKLSFKLKEPYIKTYVEHSKFTVILQIANNAVVEKESIRKNGSIIDLDVSLSSANDNIISDIYTIVDDSHAVEKEIFFSILTEEFLASLNPEY